MNWLKRNLKYIVAVLVLILLVVLCVVILFAYGLRKSSLELRSLCASYVVGETFDEAREKPRIDGSSFTYNRYPDSGNDFQLIILSQGMEPAACELQIKNGKIVSVK